MKTVLFGACSTKEKMAIARFEGVETYAYQYTWSLSDVNYVYTEEAQIVEDMDAAFPRSFVLIKKYVGETMCGKPSNEDFYVVDKERLRVSKDFINHVYENSDMYPNIEVVDVEEERPFFIDYSEILDEESICYVDKLNIYTIKRGTMTPGL